MALIAFSLAIALLVQHRSGVRAAGGSLTGGPIGTAGSGEGAPGGGMPTAGELADMSPREAADRLFDRAMREGEEGDPERSQFFAEMALTAYGRVGMGDLDTDAFFHIGLLHLAMGDPGAARGIGEALLSTDSEQLYGLVIEARAADAEGRTEDAAATRERLRAAIEGGVSLDDPAYAPHRSLIEGELSSADG